MAMAGTRLCGKYAIGLAAAQQQILRLGFPIIGKRDV